MVLHATEVNARLRGVYPDGFALDDAHRPHLTVMQAYVDADLLEDSFAAIDTVAAGEPIASWTLTAIGCYYIPGDGIGLAGIVVVPTSDLLRLQRSLLDTVAPFTVALVRQTHSSAQPRIPISTSPRSTTSEHSTPRAQATTSTRTSPSASQPATTSTPCSPSHSIRSRSHQSAPRHTSSRTTEPRHEDCMTVRSTPDGSGSRGDLHVRRGETRWTSRRAC